VGCLWIPRQQGFQRVTSFVGRAQPTWWVTVMYRHCVAQTWLVLVVSRGTIALPYSNSFCRWCYVRSRNFLQAFRWYFELLMLLFRSSLNIFVCRASLVVCRASLVHAQRLQFDELFFDKLLSVWIYLMTMRRVWIDLMTMRRVYECILLKHSMGG
jgi:hypothetical protein